MRAYSHLLGESSITLFAAPKLARQLRKGFPKSLNGAPALLSALFLLSGLGIGLFASTIANTQQEAMLTVFMTLLPAIFLSGFFFPLQNMPKFLQFISYFIPLRYFLKIIRVLLLKGVGVESIKTDVLALAVFGVLIMGAAARRFRKRLD